MMASLAPALDRLPEALRHMAVGGVLALAEALEGGGATP